MNTRDAEQMAWELMNEFGLDHLDWTFRWDNATQRFGCCRSSKKIISLSKPLTRLNPVEEVEDVIRHEIAHALAPITSRHDAAWKRMCLVTGARPERCYDSRTVVQPPKPWRLSCPCGAGYERYRRSRGTYIHNCGSKMQWVRVA